MDLTQEYERIKNMEQTPEIACIIEKLESFINKIGTIETMAAEIDNQIMELNRLSDELEQEQAVISNLIAKTNGKTEQYQP